MDNLIVSDEESVRSGIGFFGGCGSNIGSRILHGMNREANPHLSILVGNTDRELLLAKYDPRYPGNEDDESLKGWMKKNPAGKSLYQLIVLQLGKSGQGAGGDPKIGKAATEEKMGIIDEFLEPLDHFLVVGGLGKGTGTAAIPLVAKRAMDKGISTLAIVTMPFAFEGDDRLEKAITAKAELLKICPTIIIHNQKISNKKAGFDDVWQAVDGSCLIPAIFMLGEIIQKVGRQMNADLNDYRAVLRGGRHAFFGLTELKRSDTFDAASTVRALIEENSLQDNRIVRNARRILCWFHGEWMLNETEEIVEEIKEKLNKSALKGLEIFTGVMQESGDDKKLVGMLSTAMEGPDEREPEEEFVRTSHAVPEPVPQNGDQRLDLEATEVILVWNSGRLKSCEVSVPKSVAERWKRIKEADQAEAKETLRLVRCHGKIGTRSDVRGIDFEIEMPSRVVIGSHADKKQ